MARTISTVASRLRPIVLLTDCASSKDIPMAKMTKRREKREEKIRKERGTSGDEIGFHFLDGVRWIEIIAKITYNEEREGRARVEGRRTQSAFLSACGSLCRSRLWSSYSPRRTSRERQQIICVINNKN